MYKRVSNSHSSKRDNQMPKTTIVVKKTPPSSDGVKRSLLDRVLLRNRRQRSCTISETTLSYCESFAESTDCCQEDETEPSHELSIVQFTRSLENLDVGMSNRTTDSPQHVSEEDSIEPDLLNAYLKAQKAMAKGELDGALETLDRVLTLDADSRLHLLRAQILALLGHHGMALQAYQEQLKRCKSDQQANLLFACSRLTTKLGLYSKAVEYGRKELRLDPDNARIHQELARIYQDKLYDYKMALYHYQEELKLEMKALKSISDPPELAVATRQIQATRQACGRLQFLAGNIRHAVALSVQAL